MSKYTKNQINFLKQLREEGISWDEVADEYNLTFNDNKTPNALRKTLKRIDVDIVVSELKKSKRHSKNNKLLRKENDILLEQQLTLYNIYDKLQSLIKTVKINKLKIPKLKRNKKKKNMTMEILLSDAHIGKKSNTFNFEIAKDRIINFTQEILKEIDRNTPFYNVEKIVLAMLGDNIENSIMHGSESLAGCEFQNSEQVEKSIELFFEHLITPLALTGIQIVIPCVTGNHSRPEKLKTFNDPGKVHLSWIIYKMLELLSKKAGFKNLTFIISDSVFCTYDIYNDLILYEHGDHGGGTNELKLEAHMHKRGKQIGKLIKFMRIGHWHKHMSFDRGKIIINGSICGIDSYASIKGYSGDPSQTINYYIENKDRPDSFYKTFPVFLK